MHANRVPHASVLICFVCLAQSPHKPARSSRVTRARVMRSRVGVTTLMLRNSKARSTNLRGRCVRVWEFGSGWCLQVARSGVGRVASCKLLSASPAAASAHSLHLVIVVASEPLLTKVHSFDGAIKKMPQRQHRNHYLLRVVISVPAP